jgi:hypothetical protein
VVMEVAVATLALATVAVAVVMVAIVVIAIVDMCKEKVTLLLLLFCCCRHCWVKGFETCACADATFVCFHSRPEKPD